MSGSLGPGTQQAQPDETDTSRDEVQTLIQSARRASEAGDDIILPRLDKGDGEVDDTDQAEEEEDEDFQPGYWDASGMAPLNATSLVSTHCTLPLIAPIPLSPARGLCLGAHVNTKYQHNIWCCIYPFTIQ